MGDQGDDTAEDTGPVVPSTEQDCTDGEDADQDGLTDCADPDCAAEFQCTWPEAMDHRTLVQFVGNEIECKYAGFPFDYDVPDCTTDFSGMLSEAEGCAGCDRTYEGPFTYAKEECTELVGGGEVPTSGAYGFVFISEDRRELWTQDEGAWVPASELTRQGDEWLLTVSEDIIDDPEDCDNGPQNLGRLTVTLSFKDK